MKNKYDALTKNSKELAEGATMCISSAKRIEQAIIKGTDIDIENERILHSAVTAASSAVRSQVSALILTED